ncbi:hypothetical protein FisN_26Lh060 [Fistulifera solaris]|uniref:Uncharacterized protein n=1 Tax=Fistulifera solaris TaxID=1519565 RepID=A0A1Z5KCN7_FISSO|nr:hypothetical protein FisN_26Lh060 [Fistulifera solaris]|eukprot:GAX23997.1 hypothetical protein FisN_26Lh060 [Fistulifera solaris]
MPLGTLPNSSKRTKKKKKKKHKRTTQAPPKNHHHRSQKQPSILQEEIEQQLRRQRQAAPNEPFSLKRRRVGKYVYDEEKKGYFPVDKNVKPSKADSLEPLFPSTRRRRERQQYPWMLEAPVTVCAHQRYAWLNEWAGRRVWKQSSLKMFPCFPASISSLPPLWCRTFQPSALAQNAWMLQEGHIVWQPMEPSTASSSSTPGQYYALRMFENKRYQFNLEYSEQGTILYQIDLQEHTYQARVHTRGEVYDVLRLSNGVVVYSYSGGRLEGSLQTLPKKMNSDILCLEEYQWKNSNGNSTILIVMGHRNGTVSLWDVSHRAPVTAHLPSFVKPTGPVVAILCVPQSRAVLVQTASGGIHRYAVVGRYQLVYEFSLERSASPGAVRGMAVDPTKTAVWCPHVVSEKAELRLCSLATGQWIRSHMLQDPLVRLELDPTFDGGYWIRAWNAQGSHRMICLHNGKNNDV